MVRIMIILLLAGSAFLGWRAMQQQTVIDRYEAAIAEGGDVERRAKSILENAHRYTALKERSAKEGMKGRGTNSVSSYVREIAQRRNVLWGAIKIGRPQERTQLAGYDDMIYKITPQEKNAYFDRSRIANFLYLLEQESRKLRVTNIDVRLSEKSIKPHEIPQDQWVVDVTVTTRERSAKK